jgi:hypothetical protein
MSKPFFRRATLLLSIITIGLGMATHVARAQGVLDRVKRAAEEAAKKAKEQQKPQQPATTAPAGGTKPVSTGDPLSATAAPTGPVTIDPKVMPDIVGIHLGTPAREAEAALRAQYPKGAFRPWQYRLPPIAQPLLLQLSMNLDAVGAAGNDQAVVDLTPPPNNQVVWRVWRSTNFMHVNRNTLIAALREKYGKETVAFEAAIGDAEVTTDATKITDMVWLIDERGTPVAPPRSMRTLAIVGQALGPQPVNSDEQLFHGEPTINPFLQDPWVQSSGVATVVKFTRGDAQIIEAMLATTFDVPLYLRSASATAAWWRAAADKARQEDLERSRQAKPKL